MNDRRKTTWSSPGGAVVVVLLAASLLATSLHAAETSDIAVRLGHVERLLSESTAARRVEQSGNAEALALKAQADESYRRAIALNEQGDAGGAEQELRTAIRLLADAAHAAHGSEPVSQKQSDDYATRRSSVEALATAHDRVATEKGLTDMNAALQAKIAADLEEADGLLANGDAVAARSLLDATYDAVRASIETLRGGDTLVRTLSFESPEEEYRYELDRNDTHRMLADVLFAEKLAASPMRDSATAFRNRADDLRSAAESAAADERFDKAIDLLEQSTKELIRAIRSAGVYIPG